MILLKRLWNDEQGFVVSTELVFLATIMVIGLLVGLVVWRDSVLQELGDTGAAIGQFDQSYAVEIQNNPGAGIQVDASGRNVTITRTFGAVTVESTFNNYGYVDQADVCDGQDVANQPPSGISVSVPSRPEGQ